jgi:hypothetical protein
MFRRAVSQKVADIDSDGVKNIAKRHLDGFAALVMADSVMAEARDNEFVKGFTILSYDELNSFIKNDVKHVLYGFKDEFMAISTQITEYYDEQQRQAQATLQNVKGDIVQL